VQFDLSCPPERTKTLEDVIDQGDDEEWWSKDEVVRHYSMMNDRHRKRIDELLRSGQSWVGTIFRRIRDKQQRAEVRFDGLAGCLRTPSGGSANQIVVLTDEGDLRMRWMSPREYARLQGADDFPLNGTRQNLLWGFADAVCVPAIAWIDKHLLTPLYKSASRAGRSGPFL
jgi:DNA (cytosine-5)-methyltransferase 1